ncbi:helix-turn-helix domain containing protein [Peptoniphilus sp. MSJ-1]|uniref:Helix-turn-helix domain containing protein n=1 Tax=Peptoniphilus ovalis TaxID=2841503 RepID=A0ABS6FJ12_9FIRM|nr:helix-turn-helix domain-containing protein [Peptoniphilus ovalis]MBU5670164.1 helix-turn-helix domain containing protein [Peptoniphilus ovalis]
MKKYSYELKLKIVKEKEEGYGDRHLAKKYKVSRTSVKAWYNHYRYLGEEGLKEYKENPTYTEEFRDLGLSLSSL